MNWLCHVVGSNVLCSSFFGGVVCCVTLSRTLLFVFGNSSGSSCGYGRCIIFIVVLVALFGSAALGNPTSVVGVFFIVCFRVLPGSIRREQVGAGRNEHTPDIKYAVPY